MSEFPYPGLRPFQRHETDIFYGREEHTDQLIEQLGQTQFLAVTGPSGCGKSSLVRTGLLAGLETGFLATAGVHWRIAEMHPGHCPFLRLAKALLADNVLGPEYLAPFSDQDEALAFLQADLRRGPLSMHEILQDLSLPPKTNLLLLVDQFEEIFRYSQQSEFEEAAAFVALLLTSCQNNLTPMLTTHDWKIKIYVVITMRSDFIGESALFCDLSEAINQGLFLTPRLNREQLREAIEEPAKIFGSQVDPTLVNHLLNDIGNNPDHLPLLQHALMRVWNLALDEKSKECHSLDSLSLNQLPNEAKQNAVDENRSDKAQAQNKTQSPDIVLTLLHYQQIGGLNKVLSKHADEAYASLDLKQQQIAEKLFRNLVERGEGHFDVRRPVKLNDVAIQAKVSWPEVAAVVDVFSQAGRCFLTPMLEHPLEPDSIIDISHESLIRQWDRLTEWNHREAEAAEIYHRLENSARRWQQQEAELWAGIELEIALAWREQLQPTVIWAKRYGFKEGHYFELAMHFLSASEKQQQHEQKQLELARQRELQQVRHQAILEQKALTAHRTAKGALLGLLVAISLAGWGVWEREQAVTAQWQAQQALQHAERLEQERTLKLFESQLTHALLLARDEDYAAAKPVLQQMQELEGEVPRPYRQVRHLLRWFTELRGDGPRQVYEGANAQLLSVALSPDQQTLAVAGEQGVLVLFEVKTGKIRTRLHGHTNNIQALAFHPDGHWLASAGDDQRVILWSLASESKLRDWQAPARVNAIAISPNGKWLASGGQDNNVIIWDTETGQALMTLEGHKKQISSNGLDFDPTGQILGSTSHDKTARLWFLKTSEPKSYILRGHTDILQGISFSPKGDLVATSSIDENVRLWDTASGQALRVLRGHKNKVFGLNFVANGRYLITASQDHTIRIWDTDSGTTLRVLQGHTTGVTDMTTTDEQIFSVSNDGTVLRWEIALPHQFIRDLPSEPASVAISPQGQQVAVGFADGSLRLYNLHNHQLLSEHLNAHQDDVQRLAFNSEGNLLASASLDKTAKVWQLKQNTLVKKQIFNGHQQDINAVAISPNNQTLATASYDNQIGFFTISSQQLKFFQPMANEDVNAIAYDSTGKRLLSAGDHHLRLWALNGNSQPTLLQTFPKMQDLILWATLSPDAKWVASVGRDWSVRIFATDNGQIHHRFIGHEQSIHRVIFSPNSHQLATAGGDATVRFWDLISQEELFALQLPSPIDKGTPLWDFDFRCTPEGCWIAVPLTRGKLVLYDLSEIENRELEIAK